MSSCGNFTDFIHAHDAVGLQVFMTNEQNLRHARNPERNNRALFDACRVGANEICEVMISFEADVNSVIVDQSTPLSIACYNAHPACVDLLLANGADANSSNLVDCRTPLMATAAEHDAPVGLTLYQFIGNRCRCVRSLLDVGALIDQTDKHGFTALMYAVWQFRLAELLVKADADVNIINNDLNSALHYACDQNHVEVVELLLSRGVDIDAVNVDRVTPLHYACNHLHPAVVEMLLCQRADIDIVANDGGIALQWALSRATSSNRVDVLHLMATCAKTRFESNSADWIRLARIERAVDVKLLKDSAGKDGTIYLDIINHIFMSLFAIAYIEKSNLHIFICARIIICCIFQIQKRLWLSCFLLAYTVSFN